MFFSRKLFRLIHKVALFAIVFASLAPSISHALAAKNGINSFDQQICSSNGQQITIQVLTSKGQQISTVIGENDEDTKAPINIVRHLNHCPFCANPKINIAIETPQVAIFKLLTLQAQHFSFNVSQVDLSSFSVLPPPAQAPPHL
jgi:hypothetical protein